MTSTSRFFVQDGMGFLLTCSTRSLIRMLSLSAVCKVAFSVVVIISQNRKLTFFAGTKADHNIETPWETICTSSLCVFLNQSRNSCRVGLSLSSNRSQSVHSTSPYYRHVSTYSSSDLG